VFALLLLGYYLVFLIYLDYTSVSVMLCTASLTWGYLDVMERRAGWLHYLGLGLLFMLGMMVRPHGAPGSLISQISELDITHGYELVDALISHDHAYMLGREDWCKKLLPYATVPGAGQLQPVLMRKVTRGVGLYRFGPETK
jgi:hypothetical protein